MKTKLKLIGLTIIFLSFIIVKPVAAHMPGQPPFFKMNGVYTAVFPAPQSNLPDLQVPQDIPPQTYLPNESINFEIDTSQLGVPSEVVKATTFKWEMGDGTQKNGLTNTYAYSKTGSYLLTVYADYKGIPQPVLLQSTLISVVPNKNFTLPYAIIHVNDKTENDPTIDVLKFDYRNPLAFEVTSSSGEITQVLWDFGDGKSSTELTDTHQYDPTLGGTVFPLVRVTFKDNFISYAYIQIDKASPNQVVLKTQTNFFHATPLLVIEILLIIVGGIVIVVYTKKQKAKKNK